MKRCEYSTRELDRILDDRNYRSIYGGRRRGVLAKEDALTVTTARTAREIGELWEDYVYYDDLDDKIETDRLLIEIEKCLDRLENTSTQEIPSLIKYMKKNVNMYPNGKELLKYIIDFCKEWGYIRRLP